MQSIRLLPLFFFLLACILSMGLSQTCDTCVATDVVGESELDESMNFTPTGTWNFGGGKLEVPNSTTLPATCTVGEVYMDTDATSGQRIYACESANTWVLQGGAGGASEFTECFRIEVPTDADDKQSIIVNKTADNFTLTEMWCEAFGGTVNWDFQVDDGTPADVNGADLSCASGEAEDTSLGGDTTLAAGEELDLAITSTSGSPTDFVACITYTR